MGDALDAENHKASRTKKHTAWAAGEGNGSPAAAGSKKPHAGYELYGRRGVIPAPRIRQARHTVRRAAMSEAR